MVESAFIKRLLFSWMVAYVQASRLGYVGSNEVALATMLVW